MLPDDAENAAARPPMSASEALRQCGASLTLYEKKEVMEYEVLHYVGQGCADKVRAPTDGPNDGYDTEEGEYVFRTKDHIAYRYELLSELGSGAFGQVFKAIDHTDGSVVAVKLIRNQRKVLQQAEQEIKILAHLNDRDSRGAYGIVRMTDHFWFRGHICIAYELLGMNLYDYLKERDFYPMPLTLIRSIAARMLVALTFMARENIMHCDLKPENVLLRDDDPSVVKVVDLGSASFDSRNAFMYIQSRFYRAPEVIMEQHYNKAIDWWSFGCILCELANGDPVFPGEDEKDQLGSIMEYLGPPPANFVTASSPRRKREFFDENLKPLPRPTRKGKPRDPGSRPLAKFLGVSEDDEFLSFVRLFLQWDPAQRATPREAMRHPWISAEFVFPTAPPAAEVAAGDKKAELSTSTASQGQKGAVPHSPKSAETHAAPAPLTASLREDAGESGRTTTTTATQDLPPTAPAAPSVMTWTRRALQQASPSSVIAAPPTAAARAVGQASTDASAPLEHGSGTKWPSTNSPAPDNSMSASSSSAVVRGRRTSDSMQRRQNGRHNRHRYRRSTDMAEVEMPGATAGSPNTSTSVPHLSDLGPADPPKGTRTRDVVVAVGGVSSGVDDRTPAQTARVLGSESVPAAAAVGNGYPHKNEPVPRAPQSGAKNGAAAPLDSGAMPPDNARTPSRSQLDSANGSRDASPSRVRVPQLRKMYEVPSAPQDVLSPRRGSDTTFNTLPRWSSGTKAAPARTDMRQGSASASTQNQLSHRTPSLSLSNGAAAPGPGYVVRGRREYSINLDATLATPGNEVSHPPSPAATGATAADGGRMPGKGRTVPSEPAQFGTSPAAHGASDTPAFVTPKVEPRRATVRPLENREGAGRTQASAQGRAVLTNGASVQRSATATAVQAPQPPLSNSYRQRSTQMNMPFMRDGGAVTDVLGRHSAQPTGVAARSIPQRQVLRQRTSPARGSSAVNEVVDMAKPTGAAPLLPPLKRNSVV